MSSLDQAETAGCSFAVTAGCSSPALPVQPSARSERRLSPQTTPKRPPPLTSLTPVPTPAPRIVAGRPPTLIGGTHATRPFRRGQRAGSGGSSPSTGGYGHQYASAGPALHPTPPTPPTPAAVSASAAGSGSRPGQRGEHCQSHRAVSAVAAVRRSCPATHNSAAPRNRKDIYSCHRETHQRGGRVFGQ